MAKRELNGAELVGFIKERQAKQVRNLRQEYRIVPKLLIVIDKNAAPASEAYVRMKQAYASDILIEVEVAQVEVAAMIDVIRQANERSDVQGIIVQLPISDNAKTEDVIAAIAPEKDVDGLGPDARYVSATAEAIDWLLAGYNVSLDNQTICIVGNGRLVGAPLAKLWREQGYEPIVLDDTTTNLAAQVLASSLVVTATGVPRLIASPMVAPQAVVVDAGVASENGTLVGDVADDVRDRPDVTITPIKGGVGPLTVALLFDHLIQAALKTTK